ncbi:glycosyltransferase [Mycobacterium avium]|uniref:glycosyltransferase n=1 Tax=Mycobacterium avium TaxID=1764 RepID=UPI001CC5CCEC|nr:glycosyltransferase [Mycobacterium avium]MBZ4537808.1 glycosyltransferase [Mycobacterium avium subsp. hominissuis]MBZ4581142.1 glycosyltransferase [Mycobacterium avium subsp. hominissuis]MBZ4594973.1 glycosyltransferase [Mycobacterium avium subsp. hominissuis]MBZ4609053.1 glycosyltransferase [Mycobacterium avium subsp. hominissuis]MBZ4637708.1 glycosyltransferase [Mycobacterium avium subsp. hominissuis]
MSTTSPAPIFDHLLRLTDRRGTLVHARLAEPLPQHGYCTDDVARVLVVATRDHGPDRILNGLAGVALRFLNDAQALTGACRNRMDSTGSWADEPTLEDAWGRCIWGLGTAAAHSNVGWARQSAIMQFERAAQERSVLPRAMAFAALGAAELLVFDPTHRAARALLTDYASSVPAPNKDLGWPWPEPRLTYANAVVPEAMIAAGVALADATLRQRGLELLAWLVAFETADGHLSPTPAGGSGAEDTRPGFDQRPTEVSTLADACARAAAVDTDPIWPASIEAAAAWFMGDNDAGEPMWDPDTGGGYDGLRSDGVDNNQGAEATLAVISTLQHTRRLLLCRNDFE